MLGIALDDESAKMNETLTLDERGLGSSEEMEIQWILFHYVIVNFLKVKCTGHCQHRGRAGRLMAQYSKYYLSTRMSKIQRQQHESSEATRTHTHITVSLECAYTYYIYLYTHTHTTTTASMYRKSHSCR